MALIDIDTALQIADRSGAQYEILEQAFDDMDQEGNNYYTIIITLTDNPELEIPSEGSAYILDNGFDKNLNFCTRRTLGLSVTMIEAHFNFRGTDGEPLQIGGWNTYLLDNDSRVSDFFNQVFFSVHGNYLQANVVFSESVDVFGTAEVIAGLAIDYTDGVNYGTGDFLNIANGDNFAATQLKAVVENMGAVNTELMLSVKDINNLPTTITVTIPANSTVDTEIPIGTTDDRFLDIMGVTLVSGGTVGDIIRFENLKERQVEL